MSGSALTAVAFALTAGHPSDARAVLSIDPAPDPAGRRLLASVEPLEPSARGYELAGVALRTLREAFAEAHRAPVDEALGRAFAAANAALLAENRPMAGCRWERRGFVGATAIAIAGRALTIAQVPATQALVVQERQLYAFPDLASWRCDYVPASDAPPPDPLGFRDGVRPDLYRTVAARGDLIVLCSSALARCLARSGFCPADPRAEPLLAGDLERTLEQLGQIVLGHELDDVHVAGVRLDRTHGAEPAAALSAPLARLGGAWGSFGPHRPRPALGPVGRGRFRGWTPVGTGIATAGLGVPLDRPPAAGLLPADLAPTEEAPASWPADAAPDPDPDPPGGAPDPWGTGLPAAGPLPVTSDHLPSVLADGAAVGPHVRRARLRGRVQLAMVGAAEQLMARPRRRALRLEARARTYAAPGARSVRCYRGRSRLALPTEWRAHLPRGPMLRVPGRLLVLAVVLVLALGTGGIAVARQRERSARADAHLAAAEVHLAAASRAFGDGAVERLGLALEALDEAEGSGAPAEEVAARRAAAHAARDEAQGVVRFAEVARVGSLPPELAGSEVRLVRVGSEVYLVGGGLFQLDADRHRLVRVLAPGMPVEGGTVGVLRDGGWGTTGVTATDGAALYLQDEGGRWLRRPLGGDEGAAARLAACRMFRGSFYGLDPAGGRILKYAADRLDRAPEDWADTGDAPDLSQARDMVVDGQIHVLLADGRVLSLLQGLPLAPLEPEVSPPVTQPVALAGGLDTNFLYLAEPRVELDGTVGRIVRLDRTGQVVHQLLPPPGGDGAGRAAATALADVRDLVVDEAGGVLYFVTGDAVWRATLPT